MPPTVRTCAVLFVIAGCFGAADDVEVTVSRALAFEPLGRGRQALLDSTERVIKDAAEWEALNDSLRPILRLGQVDFELEMVMLAAVPVPTGGYDLRFEVIDETADGLTAGYRVFVPGADCRTTLGEGVVFQAIRLARTNAPVTFVKETETLRCTEPG